MGDLYAPVEPYREDGLDVGEGHRLHVEECGNPRGRPVVVLHGGPGSGSTPGLRRFFDPDAYRVVLFDQRGCGRSRPLAIDDDFDPSTNTTAHLVRDIEKLRVHLDIEAWVVFGVSWGVTLGLAYAERHPDRVNAMVFVGVTMTRRSEIDWLYRGVAPLFPEAWHRFRDGVPAAERDGDLVEAYHRLLLSPEWAVRDRAARDFHDWEAALLSTDPRARPPAAWADPEYRLNRARIVTQYFRNAAWLEEGVLLRDAAALHGTPAVLVHGRLDVSAPLATAWALAQAWPDAELVVVGGAGHSAGDAGMARAVRAATCRFASG